MSLGSWRFILAMLVAISHLWDEMIHGPAAYAVWGFFLISGFLMTVVMKTRYADGYSGLRDFAVNRFLRIYPAYYLACVVGLLSLLYAQNNGIDGVSLNGQFAIPYEWRSWATNLTIIPIWNADSALLVPVSGALGVEIAVYLLIPLMAKHPAVPTIGLILSSLINIKYGLQTEVFPVRYSSFVTAFVAFSIGSLVAHYRRNLSCMAAPAVSSILWIAHCLVWLKFDQWPWTYGLYTSLVLTAWVVISFEKQKSGVIDKWLGELSYPIYLFHSVAGLWWYGEFSQQRNFQFFSVSMVTAIIVSIGVVLFLDRPLEKYKRRNYR